MNRDRLLDNNRLLEQARGLEQVQNTRQKQISRQKQTTRQAQTTKHAQMVMGLVLLDALVTFIKVRGQNRPVSCLEIGYELQVRRPLVGRSV